MKVDPVKVAAFIAELGVDIIDIKLHIPRPCVKVETCGHSYAIHFEDGYAIIQDLDTTTWSIPLDENHVKWFFSQMITSHIKSVIVLRMTPEMEEEVYANGEDPFSDEGVAAFKAWLDNLGAHYYARDHAYFSEFAAQCEAWEKGKSVVFVEDLS